jgi:hypothetical protein
MVNGVVCGPFRESACQGSFSTFLGKLCSIGLSTKWARRVLAWRIVALWSRRVFALALLGGALAGGCLSPTLPLPPPSKPDVSAPDANGNVRVQGWVPGRSEAIARNERTDLLYGQLTDNSGQYDFLMPAQSCDWITLYYISGTELSAPANSARVPSPVPCPQ